MRVAAGKVRSASALPNANRRSSLPFAPARFEEDAAGIAPLVADAGGAVVLKAESTMRTLGIDLASQPAKTAACEIRWDGERATVQRPLLGLTDGALLDLIARCDVVGIDAPFGWPRAFVAFVSRQHPDAAPLPAWGPEWRDELRFRLTDRRVREALKLQPLSVAADKIALPAMRCAGLLATLGVTDRSGDGRVYEVYPAAALRVWGLASRGYKDRRAPGRPSAANLLALLAALRRACPWLDLADGAADRCSRDDDAFDALVASLVARAAALGLTARPTAAETRQASHEGWIAVPHPGSLARLVAARLA